jgi:hypothetical protein
MQNGSRGKWDAEPAIVTVAVNLGWVANNPNVC